MSTHCGISVKTEKGYETIYCHHDGYPKYMYPMLMNNYNSEELASKLIGFGDASSIDEKLEPTEDYHRFGMPEPGVCMFYGRDRGEPEEDTRPAIYTREELLRSFYYAYIFEDGKWSAYVDGKKVTDYTKYKY